MRLLKNRLYIIILGENENSYFLSRYTGVTYTKTDKSPLFELVSKIILISYIGIPLKWVMILQKL